MAGSSVEPVSNAVQNITGVHKVLIADQDNLSHHLAEPLSKLLVALHARSDTSLARPVKQHNSTVDNQIASCLCRYKFTHIVAPSSTFGRNLLPRAAALLDCQPISDVTEVLDPCTYVRCCSHDLTAKTHTAAMVQTLSNNCQCIKCSCTCCFASCVLLKSLDACVQTAAAV